PLSSSATRRRVTVRGIVQGVGFRPFVFNLAERLGIAGTVLNDPLGVEIDVEGDSDAVERFVRALEDDAPPLAVIQELEVEPAEPVGHDGFRIVKSATGAARRTLVSPDVATCEECLAEMRDPADRRHRYPFLNCTNCGPRFTIVEDIPYDRANTSMKAFPMCDPCRAEYEDSRDRRFHAQPTACPVCGPSLAWIAPGEDRLRGDAALARAVAWLRDGRIVSIKGLGGYHLACDATDEEAVARLRRRKRREAKPLALMVADPGAARRLGHVEFAAEDALSSIRRPIVLLPKREGSGLAPSVAPDVPTVGVMLPYTPLHSLLMEAYGGPLVMTSGNLTDEPMAYEDHEALERLGGIADGFLTHDRAIVMRCDDSVVRWTRRRPLMIRRARGYAPQPVFLSPPTPRPVLALGAHQKNAIALAREGHAFVSHHLGDLDTPEAVAALEEAAAHYERLFEIEPEMVACDLHPDYRSSRLAAEIAEARDLPLVRVQHHHAHAMSVAAEHGWTDPFLGISLDGTGLGTDGTIWGFEFLAVDGSEMRRLGHLQTVPMPGGEAAVKSPWRMACAWLTVAFGEVPELPLGFLERLDRERWGVLERAVERGINAPLCSSAGRLFDAVATICGLRDEADYEGQPAIELEGEAARVLDPVEGELPTPWPFEVVEPAPWDGEGDSGAEGFEVRLAPAVGSIAEALAAGSDVPDVAARFHATVVAAIVRGAERAREREGLETVALSGGTFQNAIVLERSIDALSSRGFDVRINEAVSPNDGGIALGQVAVAANVDRRAGGS
ncbi:MAG: carbamoyltransferase HypF, partial [Gemmatimonadota bacterium]|nr:carbamoyltransferase HypF [Gemmatimonadota bacterium]